MTTSVAVRGGIGDPRGRSSCRPPAPSSRRRRSFQRWPDRRSPVEPNVLIPCGWASWRRRRISWRVPLTPRPRPPGAAAALRRRRSRPPRAPSCGRRSRAPAGGGAVAAGAGDLDPLEDRRQLAAVGVGVHPHRAADRAGDVDAELDPGQALRARRGPRPPAAARRRRRAGAGLDRDRRELAVELDHEARHALVGDQQVRPRPERRTPPARSRSAHASSAGSSRPAADAGEETSPRRRCDVVMARQRDRRAVELQRVAGSPAGPPGRTRPSRSTSPAPITTHTSPSPSTPASTRPQRRGRAASTPACRPPRRPPTRRPAAR